jgi:hypothetical protein
MVYQCACYRSISFTVAKVYRHSYVAAVPGRPCDYSVEVSMCGHTQISKHWLVAVAGDFVLDPDR